MSNIKLKEALTLNEFKLNTPTHQAAFDNLINVKSELMKHRREIEDDLKICL